MRLYSTIVIRDDDFTCLGGQPVSLSSSEIGTSLLSAGFDAICEDPRHTQDEHISRAISFHPLLLTIPFLGLQSNGALLHPSLRAFQ